MHLLPPCPGGHHAGAVVAVSVQRAARADAAQRAAQVTKHQAGGVGALPMLRLALPVQNLAVNLSGRAASLLLLLEPQQLILQQQAASGLAAAVSGGGRVGHLAIASAPPRTP